ncbi:unnamed protein product [Clonostachys solani]|uniref:Uncharacterized protein n=1 Tax=Clonostachys solani TaxID=160281 RepID=A0A9N9Z505_9HYPO|nr:unnamed protein product [Clonostachys solani]
MEAGGNSLKFPSFYPRVAPSSLTASRFAFTTPPDDEQISVDRCIGNEYWRECCAAIEPMSARGAKAM